MDIRVYVYKYKYAVVVRVYVLHKLQSSTTYRNVWNNRRVALWAYPIPWSYTTTDVRGVKCFARFRISRWDDKSHGYVYNTMRSVVIENAKTTVLQLTFITVIVIIICRVYRYSKKKPKHLPPVFSSGDVSPVLVEAAGKSCCPGDLAGLHTVYRRRIATDRRWIAESSTRSSIAPITLRLQ